MNQQKIGSFLKQLRKQKALTQEEFAEIMNVSNRTVSRWETGSNLPDLDILISISDFYEVDLREIMDGERKSEKMNRDLEETVIKVADYTNMEKEKLMKRTHAFAWVGVITFLVFFIMSAAGVADQGIGEDIASFALGLSFGMMIVTVLYTGKYIVKLCEVKKRLFQRQ